MSEMMKAWLGGKEESLHTITALTNIPNPHILLAILRMPACLSFSTELVCAFRPVTDERVEVDVCEENIF